MRLAVSVVCCLVFVASCTGGSTRQISAFNTLDPCTDYDEATCLDNEQCEWFALGAPCIEGEPCKSGVCQQIDPCRTYTDADACASDTANQCAWAATELCPADNCGDGGFCYQATDEQPCACACPICPEGEACPPCECDCKDDSCVCSGTVCPDNDPSCVPEYECTCDGGDGGDCGTEPPPEPA